MGETEGVLSGSVSRGGVHWAQLLSMVVDRGETGVPKAADPEANSADAGLKLTRP